MAAIILFSESLEEKKKYVDKTIKLTPQELEERLSITSTIYVGTFPYDVEESHIYSIFNNFGPIKKVIMGINPKTKQNIGFCFIEFYSRDSALLAVSCKDHFKISGKKVFIDLDRGFEEGRQFGRGEDGNQKYLSAKKHQPYKKLPYYHKH